jgi:hypothetical protein
MKELSLALALIACSACSSTPIIQEALKAEESRSITLSRYLTIKTCYTGQKKCIGPVAKELDKANIQMVLEPFFKGDVQGEIAHDKHRIVENGIAFKTEIRFLKKQNEEGYYIYMMLRSGPGVKRNGKVKTFKVIDLSKLSETKISDDPIKFDCGTLQAELVLGPSVNLSN